MNMLVLPAAYSKTAFLKEISIHPVIVGGTDEIAEHHIHS
jgi:hypothetical protein